MPDKQLETPTKIWNRSFISICLVNIFFNIGQYMITSLLPKQGNDLGFSASQIGVLASGFAITSFCLRFIAGPVIDSVNRKRLLFFAMGCVTVSYVCFGLVESFGALLGFRLLQGVGTAFGNACCLAMVSETIPKEKFTTGVGYFSCVMVFAQAVAPSIGLKLVDWFNYTAAYLFAAAIMMIAIVLNMLIKLPPRENKKFKVDLKNAITKYSLLPAFLIFLVGVGFSAINSFLIVFAEMQGADSDIGLFFTVYAVFILVARPFIGRAIDKFGFVKIGIPSLTLTALSFFLICYSTKLWMFLVAAVLNALGYGATQPAMQSLCLKTVSSEHRGAASSLVYLGMDGGALLGPFLAGLFADIWGYYTMWILMTIPVIISIIVIFLSRKTLYKIENDF